MAPAIFSRAETGSRQRYLPALMALLCRPKEFFRPGRLAAEQPQALRFLVLSALFSTLATALGTGTAGRLPAAAIHMINALGMTAIGAGLGHMVMVMAAGRRVTFSRFFSVYAFAAGTTLVFSWVPFSFWFTEPWKWWLIWTGLVIGLGLPRRLALAIIAMTVCILTLLFQSLLPLLAASG
ncbi:MAG: hypothetical protein JEZ11_19465 [Desulfobacterales bacterium]|nr:hypothetical protein [Desulfobacterales bacterium]